MTPEDESITNFSILVMKIIAWLGINFTASMINAILGNLFLVLSISYLAWKWRRDILKNRKENGKR